MKKIIIAKGIIPNQDIYKCTGITLIALIITIIIILILAGITISQLTNNGLFINTQTAKEKYSNATTKEEDILNQYENAINSGEIVSGRNPTQRTVENTMSGTEHFIGEYYIDGKPIYEKTFYIASLPNNTEKSYNHGIQNVDNIWTNEQKSFCMFGGNVSKVNFAYGQHIFFSGITSTLFYITTDYNRSNVSAYITVQYTKTTDTATITPNITTLTEN